MSLVKAAREQAAFPFFWGFECEWHPKYESWYRDFLRAETGAEYLVYGSHWVEVDGCFEYIPDAGDPRNLKPYVDLTLEGLSSGLFDLFAHPDIFLAGFPRWDADLKAASKDIIAAAIAAGIPMEVNGLGVITSYSIHYTKLYDPSAIAAIMSALFTRPPRARLITRAPFFMIFSLSAFRKPLVSLVCGT